MLNSKIISFSFKYLERNIRPFDLIGSKMAWKVGNGKQVQLGEDPWVGSSPGYILPKHMIKFLHFRGIFTLIQIVDHNYSSWKGRGWFKYDLIVF